MKRRGICVLTAFFLCVSLLFAGQRAGTLAKSGDKAAMKGDYYAAAESYLDALAKKPKSTKTIEKLREVALPAYDQKLKLAEQYRNGGNLEGALREFKELEQFVDKLRQYNALVFMTIDFAKTFSEVSEGAAETRYKNAEGYFAGQNFDKAIEEYRAALGLKSPYKDCLDKIAESYYRIGTADESRGAYRRAAETYLKAGASVPNYKDSKQKAVAIYCALGDHFSAAGQYRKAFEDYSLARGVDPQFPDLAAKLTEAKNMATLRIAFVRFDNPTGQNIAGMALGDVILESIRSKLQARASQFIASIDRDDLLAIAREQRISEGMFGYDLSAPVKLSGVDYLVIGKLNQVRDLHAGLSRDRASGEYEYRYYVPYTDKNGKQKTRTEYVTERATFDLFQDSIKLTVGGAIKVIESKSGVTAINHQIMEERGDEILYGENFQLAGVRNLDQVTFDSETQKLINARRELVDAGTIVNKMINAIADAVANKILVALDQPPRVSDPSALKY